MPPDTARAPSWQPRHCPDCGYALQGLPECGVCPECGAAYEPGHIVLYGWAGALKSNLGNSPHGRTLALLLAFCGAFMVVSASYRGRAGPWGVAAGLVFLAAISLILYRRRALGDPPVQVRLLPEGLAQRDGVGPVTPEPWAGRWELRLLPQPSGRRRLLVHKVAEPEGGDAAYCVVDFEFHCDDNQAWELCRRVRQIVDRAGGEIDATAL